MSLTQRILSTIRNCAGNKVGMLHEPVFKGNELKYLQDCIHSNYVSYVGEFVDRFESELADYTGSKYSVAVVNGTESLHVALILAEVKSGDEVLIPALTFVATANAVSYCGAKPHFVDSEKNTLGMAPEALRAYLESISEQRNGVCINRKTGSPIRAMVPVHIFGHPCRLEELMEVARDFNLVMIEDAAESLGSRYQGRHTGTFGLLGTLSFNGNKIITTGGGGAILTDDHNLAKRAKHLTTTAKVAHRWEYFHDEIGFNYRMSNISAALGCAQLEQLPEFIASKRRLYNHYKNAFRNIDEVQLFSEPENSNSNYWLQALLLNDSVVDKRDAILEGSNAAGIMTRPVWKLLNKLPPYVDCPSSLLPVAESMEKSIINLPSGMGIV